jgi:hypothetical protein
MYWVLFTGPEDDGDDIEHSGEALISLFVARAAMRRNALIQQKKFSTR